jgi:hypothetical protein
MGGVLGKHAAQVTFADDQHPVGELGADGQHDAFGELLAVYADACGRSGRDRRFASWLMAGSGVDRSWADSSTKYEAAA